MSTNSTTHHVVEGYTVAVAWDAAAGFYRCHEGYWGDTVVVPPVYIVRLFGDDPLDRTEVARQALAEMKAARGSKEAQP